MSKVKRDMVQDASADNAGEGSGEERSKQSIFILKAKYDSLKAAEVFLRNRKWELETTTDLRGALAAIFKSKPAYVFICIDHPNPKVKALPKLLMQAFSSHIIVFAERVTTQATASIQESGCEYSLLPPVSGPAIERIILKIQRDQARKQEEAFARSNGSQSTSGESSSVISIRGDQSGDKDAVISQAKNALTQLMKAEGSGDHGGASIIGGESSRSGPGASFRGTSVDGERDPALESNPGYKYHAPIEEEGSRSRPKNGITPQSNSEGGVGPLGGDSDDKHRKNHGYKFRSEWTRKDGRFKEDSIIVKGTQKSLDETVVIGHGVLEEQVSVCTRISCLAVNSGRFSGYLLAAYGYDRRIDDDFMRSIRFRLVEFMRSQGEDFNADAHLQLNLEEVTFEGWAMEQAEFLRRSVHNGQEIAIAFFPDKATEAELEISAREDMLKLNIEELKGDTEVEFDLYLYFPTNDKYILYTREGGTFYENQKSRLKGKGVKNVHLKKDSSIDLRRYRVQNFLNDKIESYRGRSKKKRATRG